MSDAKLKTHKKVDIFVGTDGKFWCEIGHDRYSRKDLRALEREIEQRIPKGERWPGMDLLNVSDRNNYGSYGVKKVRVSGYREQKSSSGYQRSTSIYMLDERGHDIAGAYSGSYYAYDVEVETRLIGISREIERLKKEWAEEVAKLGTNYHAESIKQLAVAWEEAHPIDEAVPA